MVLDIALIVVSVLLTIVSLASCVISAWLFRRYRRFNKQENSIGKTGTQIAREILDNNGLQHIQVKRTGSLFFGNSYSHYFKKVRLRSFIRHENSLTSVGMGAQKAALAILDKENDPDMRKRIRLIPLITFGPFAFIPLVVIGALLDFYAFNESGVCTIVLGCLGILFYAYAIVLSVQTLKTERKAQQRAYEILRDDYHITDSELTDLKDLFHLYNVQYVNDIILSSLELLYTVLKVAAELNKNK